MSPIVRTVANGTPWWKQWLMYFRGEREKWDQGTRDDPIREPGVERCPFCGTDRVEVTLVELCPCWAVRCWECDCEGPVNGIRQEAINSWNAAVRVKLAVEVDE